MPISDTESLLMIQQWVMIQQWFHGGTASESIWFGGFELNVSILQGTAELVIHRSCFKSYAICYTHPTQCANYYMYTYMYYQSSVNVYMQKSLTNVG